VRNEIFGWGIEFKENSISADRFRNYREDLQSEQVCVFKY